MSPTLPTYDSRMVLSQTLSPAQAGTVTGGSYVEATYPLTIGSGGRYGLSFDFSVTNEAERGLALAPRIPFTTATSDPAGTGETATTWTIRVPTTETSVPTAALILYGVLGPTPSAWAGATNPSSILVGGTGVFIIDSTIGAASPEWVLNGSTYDLVFSFDFHTSYNLGAGGALARPFWTLVNSVEWNGLVQFVISHIGGTIIYAAGPTFAGNVHRPHTGRMDVRPDLRSRPVHDYITGQPYLSHEAIPDGFRDGILIHPDNFDPSDPRSENPWTPPPGEGVVDDNVVDLE